MPIATTNPLTGEVVRTFIPLSARELETRLQRSRDAFGLYRNTSIADRAAILNRAAVILENERNQLAALMTLEMGKPVKAAAEEAAKCATACRYYAEHGERLLADRLVETHATRSFVRFRPWVPYWQ